MEAFPTTRGGVIRATGLANGPTSPSLAAAFAAEQRTAQARWEGVAVPDIPSLEAWRRVFGGFGAQPTRHRNAAEALLRRLLKQGEVPSINLLVDVANLVSLRFALPVAVFDRRGFADEIAVRFADGTERFTDLGSGEIEHPEPGEVVFVDETGVVVARRWCWRQSAQSAAIPDTREALITVEGQHPGAESDVAAAVSDLVALLAEFQPGADVEQRILSPAAPSFSRRPVR